MIQSSGENWYWLTEHALGLFDFLVGAVFFAPRAMLFERQLALGLADVFVCPVVEPLADRALQTHEIWLWHIRCCSNEKVKMKNAKLL